MVAYAAVVGSEASVGWGGFSGMEIVRLKWGIPALTLKPVVETSGG